MHSNYKQDEAAIRSIISNNASATDPDSAIHLITYYENKRTSQLIMKNSKVDSDPLKKHGLVYRIICPENGCNHSYIGMTTTRLSKRLSVHLQEGNFFQHFRQHHGVLQRPALLENTSIIDRDQDRCPLRLREALHIMKLKPTLNITQETLLLPTNVRRTRPLRNEETIPVGIPVRTPAGPATNHNPEIPVGAAENDSQTLPSQNPREIPAETPAATPANPTANENVGILDAAEDPVNPPP